MTTANGTAGRVVPNGDGADLQTHDAPEKRPHGYFLSDRARVAEIDGIRGLLKYEQPGVISFPNPTTFPFSSITLNLKAPLDDRLASSDPNALPVPEAVTIDGPDLEFALQYGPTPGLPTIRGWLETLQEKVHGRKKGDDWTLSMATGSQDGMFKTFAAVLNPGDPVLLETPCYAGVLPPLRVLNSKLVEVPIDENGLSAEGLEHMLATWPEAEKRPKVIYCCPTGCNPSGCSSSKERKLEILKIAKKYGLLILEDDPYYYLAENVIPSYFALETQIFPEGGHVVRFDSFSKLLSAGLRLGYATGPPDIIHAIDVTTAGAQLHPSSISQAVAYGLLNSWGHDGFLSHSRVVAQFYAERRATFEALAHKYLDGLASWVSPVAGMFLWLDFSPAGIKDSSELISKDALSAGVLCTPGFAFFPNPRVSHHCRLSFSLVDLDHDAEVGFTRLRDAIKEKQKKLGLTNGTH